MANLTILTDPISDIEYSIQTGTIREFCLLGDILYSEEKGITTPGWKSELLGFIIDQNLMDDHGTGLPACIYRVQEDIEAGDTSYFFDADPGEKK